MGVQIKSGNNSAGLANVDSNFNLNVVTPQTEADAGFAQMSSEVDSGIVTGSRKLLAPEVSDDYRMRMGLDFPLFNLSFEGTVFPSGHLTTAVSSGTVTNPGTGFMLLTGTVTAGQYAIVRTHRVFPLFGSYQVFAEMWIKEDINYNSTFAYTEWGFGYPSTTAVTASDGAFFRRIPGGDLQAVVCVNGVEFPTTLNTANVLSRDGVSAYSPVEPNHYVIAVGCDQIEFWLNDHLLLEYRPNSTQVIPTRTSSQQIFGRVITLGGTASALRVLYIGMITASIGDMAANKPWAHIVTAAGGGSYQIQPGTGAVGPTVTRASGAAGWPASATARIPGTWTATSAPALNSLGGFFQTPAMSTLSSDSDYPIFAWLNTAGATANTGKNLHITSIRVGEAYGNTAATVNPICMNYIVAVGSMAATLATTDSTTATQPRGTVVGAHAWSASDFNITGSTKPGFEVKFDSPLFVPPGTYFHFVARPFGTVASNALQFSSSLAVNGYFD